MSMVLARQGENKTLEDFRKIYDYCTEDFKTKNKKYTYTFGCLTDDPLSEMIATKKIFGKTDGRQYIQMIVSPTPINNGTTDDEFMEMAKEFGEYYYKLGYHCNVSVHHDTDKRHIHLIINSVPFTKQRKFSQSISQLNRFKFHCNRILDKYGFDIIKMTTESMLDNKDYSFNGGYDFLEAYDEIAQDIAFNFYDVSENVSTGYSSNVPDESSKYNNPDWPRPTFNRFFAANSVMMAEYYNIGQNPVKPAFDIRNAWGSPYDARPMTPFNTADMTPTIIIQDQSPYNNYQPNYYPDIPGNYLKIDHRRTYDVYVPNTVDPKDINGIVTKIPLLSEKEKNDAIRSATAAQVALDRKNDDSKVLLDLSEHINIHFDDGNADSILNIIDVDYKDYNN